MKSLHARNVTCYEYIFDTFGALVLPTFSTCFLVEHPFEIDVRAFACFLFFKNELELEIKIERY